ncbi:unnamed protein product, partial [Brenthis ino]
MEVGFEKCNVLSKIVIPRLNVTSHYILGELEEKEREETFRLKRVKEKKDLDKKIEEIRRRMETEEGQQDKENPEVPKPLVSDTKPDEVNKNNADLKVMMN